MSPTPKKRPIDLTQKTDVKDTDVLLFSSQSGDYSSTFSNIVKLAKKHIHHDEVGEIKSFAINDIPEGYLKMDGSQHTINDYPILWKKINGVLDGVIDNKDGSFNLPNWTDYFLRYAPNRKKLGETQPWAIENIKGSVGHRNVTDAKDYEAYWTLASPEGPFYDGEKFKRINLSSDGLEGASPSPKLMFDASKVVNACTETRPMNVNVIYAIKCDLK